MPESSNDALTDRASLGGSETPVYKRVHLIFFVMVANKLFDSNLLKNNWLDFSKNIFF